MRNLAIWSLMSVVAIASVLLVGWMGGGTATVSADEAVNPRALDFPLEPVFAQRRAEGGTAQAKACCESGNCPGWGSYRVSCCGSTCSGGSWWVTCGGSTTYCPPMCAANGICWEVCQNDPDCPEQCVQGEYCSNDDDCLPYGECINNSCDCPE